jgi:hypothetical protein
MSYRRIFDTVAFDVRGNATMLFFANTADTGDITDYVLLMRTIGDDFDESLYIEANEKQVGGQELLSEARLVGNCLTLVLNEPAAALDDAREFVLAFEGTEDNLRNIEAGVFRVLGDALVGGNA